MGRYFVMSKHFDKCKASDFNLVQVNTETAVDPADGSLWVKVHLYDFGWGKENGYYKTPLPAFNELLELVLRSPNMEDQYGAAAVILEKYPENLLDECETIMKDHRKKQDFKTLATVFILEKPINRCNIINKSYNEIRSDYIRWKKIAGAASKTLNE